MVARALTALNDSWLRVPRFEASILSFAGVALSRETSGDAEPRESRVGLQRTCVCFNSMVSQGKCVE